MNRGILPSIASVMAVVGGVLLDLCVVQASEFGRHGLSGNPSTNGGAACVLYHPSGVSPTVAISGPTVIGGTDVSVSDFIGTSTRAVTVQNGSDSLPVEWPPPVSGIALDEHISGLVKPVAIAHAGDERLFVVEQAGRIRIIDEGGNLLVTPFLDIESQVDDSGSEMGLLGLAFHPDFATNGYFFVYYTQDGYPGLDRSRVSRFQVSAKRDVADAGSEQVILTFEQPFSNHNAGDLHFGSDGYLYIASGDGGSAGDPGNRAQNDQLLLGKLLRIDVDVTPGPHEGPDCDLSGNHKYQIPTDNAYTDGPGNLGCDEIYMSGLRNPWRFSFDRETGDLWIADVGQNNYEEINAVRHVPGRGGLDFGWRCYEGRAPFNLTSCNGQYFFPLQVLDHAEGNCSVIGGFVYRGSAYPDLVGHYFFTDFCNTAIRTLSGPPGAVVLSEQLPAGIITSPSTFGEDAEGELYIASLGEGRVYRVRSLSIGSPAEF